jgi:hypothetical protein
VPDIALIPAENAYMLARNVDHALVLQVDVVGIQNENQSRAHCVRQVSPSTDTWTVGKYFLDPNRSRRTRAVHHRAAGNAVSQFEDMADEMRAMVIGVTVESYRANTRDVLFKIAVQIGFYHGLLCSGKWTVGACPVSHRIPER